MKLAKETVDILKNFAAINTQIMVRSGTVLRTISPQKTIMAKAEVADAFPRDFAIYDLTQFLSALSLFQDPDVDFGEKSLEIIGSNDVRLSYTYASPENILAAPSKDIKLPSEDIIARVSKADLLSVTKAASVLNLTEVSVVGDGSRVYLVAGDFKNKSSNTFRLPLDHDKVSTKFSMIFKTENLVKVMPGDYELKISAKGLSSLKGDVVQYWIPTETTSKFGE